MDIWNREDFTHFRTDGLKGYYESIGIKIIGNSLLILPLSLNVLTWYGNLVSF